MTIVGDLTVTAKSLQTAASTDESATASADLDVRAGTGTAGTGDLTIVGDIKVDAVSTVTGNTGSAGAKAEAFAKLDAAGNVNVTTTGGINVTATALNSATATGAGSDATADYAYASADLFVDAGGNVTIAGDITVAADARVLASALDGDAIAMASAYAVGEANIDADGLIDLNGNITVTGTALNTAIAALTAASPASVHATADSAFAFAYLDIGENGTADAIDIAGDTLVDARAEMFASADANLSGAGGAVEVEAYTAYGTATGSAELEASNSVTTGAITVSGTAMQTANATMVGTAAASVRASNTSYSNAAALLYVDAPSGGITIDGVVAVNALYRTFASANGGTGAIDVDAVTSWGYATATADLDASGLIDIDGNVTVTGTMLNTALAGATAASPADVYAFTSGGSAYANLFVGDDSLSGGTAVDISGAIDVDATVALLASADADLSAGDGGTANVQAYTYYGDATASADLNAVNSVTTGDITVNGTLLQTALASTTGSGRASVYASNSSHSDATAYLFIDVPGSGEGDGITVNGDIEVTALDHRLASANGGSGATTASVYNEDTAYAYASANLNAGGLIDLNGDVTVTGTALGTALAAVTGGSPGNVVAGNSYATAYAYLNIGTSDADDIDVAGDIVVSADAELLASVAGDVLDNAGAFTSASNSYYAYASASADLDADNSVTVHDVTVTGTALSTARNTVSGIGVETAYAYGASFQSAYASLDIDAGGTDPGDGIHIIGDTVVTAHAATFASVDGSATETAFAFAGFAYAFASADLDAATLIDIDGNVTVTGTALSTANATLSSGGPFSDAYATASYASATAYLNIGDNGSADEIDITGATLVNAEAVVKASVNADLSGDGGGADVKAITFYGDASASAEFRAANSVTTGAITVEGTVLQTANATMTGTGPASNVLASNTSYSSGKARLFVDAPAGNIAINGDVAVNALYNTFASANGGTGATDVEAVTSWGYATATADLDASGLIDIDGNVTVTGTMLNTALAAATAASPADVSADVYGGSASAYLFVGNGAPGTAVDISGAIDVDATIELFASADADLSAGLGGAAVVEAYTSYGSAYASADLNAANSVTTGGITVSGTLLQTALASTTGSGRASVYASNSPYSDATAYLFIDVPGAGEGDGITVDGDIEVTAWYRMLASVDGGSGATTASVYNEDTAYAYASANLDAGGLIDLNGNVTVTGTALGTALATVTGGSPNNVYASNAYATAYAYLNIGTSDAEDIDVAGDIVVSADAELLASVAGDVLDNADAFTSAYNSYYAYASASAELAADNTVTVHNVTVTGTALSTALNTVSGTGVETAYAYAYGSDSQSAYAILDIYAGGEDPGDGIHIIGDTVVTARAETFASVDGSATDFAYAYAGFALASATAGFDAATLIDIDGDVTVTGTALTSTKAVGSGGIGSSSQSYASADAGLRIGDGSAGNIDISGAITVAATTRMVGANHDSGGDASATANLEADNNITVAGDITVTARASATNATVEGYDQSADANLLLDAGSNLDINGDITVDADAILEGASVSGAFAYADADLDAGTNVTINGALSVTADALADGTTYADSASATARLFVDAGNTNPGDVSITGDTLVTASATNIRVGGASDSALSAVANAAAAFAADNIDLFGDIAVTADATRFGNGASSSFHTGDSTILFFGGSSSARADAELAIVGRDDVIVEGNITVTGTAHNTIPSSFIGGGAYATASADLLMVAGDDGVDGSLSFTGDAEVRANATMTGTGSTAFALAEAEFLAANDVTITTGAETIRVASEATGIGRGIDAFANVNSFGTAFPALLIEAGLGAAGGSVSVTGNIEVSAAATATDRGTVRAITRRPPAMPRPSPRAPSPPRKTSPSWATSRSPRMPWPAPARETPRCRRRPSPPRLSMSMPAIPLRSPEMSMFPPTSTSR